MIGIPFIPIIPICFQCGTNQNPCHCKVVGPTLGELHDIYFISFLSIFAVCLLFYFILISAVFSGFFTTVVAAVSQQYNTTQLNQAAPLDSTFFQ